MNKKIKVLGICGSLRKESYNKKLLHEAIKLVPETMQIEIAEIGDLPLFNQDLEASPPEPVLRFREQVKNADALLLVTPEYNYSISAVLKNALEWGSRPYGAAVMNGKPVAIMGASTGMMGTGRAQYHLRQICVQINMYPLNKPEVIITFVKEKFDEKGNLTDEKTRTKIKELLDGLVVWIKKFS